MNINNTFIDEKLLRLLVKNNFSNNQIAEKLGIRPDKVRYFCKKLGIKPFRLQTIHNDTKILTISLPVELWDKLKVIQGQTYNDKFSYLINNSRNLEFLDVGLYQRDYRKDLPEVTCKRKQLTLSLFNYQVLKSKMFKKKVTLNFAVWFLIKTHYVK